MNQEEFNELDPGLYKIFWKSGGSSLAAIGPLCGGERWFAPTNWLSIGGAITHCTLHDIRRVELISSKLKAHSPRRPTSAQSTRALQQISDLTARVTELENAETARRRKALWDIGTEYLKTEQGKRDWPRAAAESEAREQELDKRVPALHQHVSDAHIVLLDPLPSIRKALTVIEKYGGPGCSDTEAHVRWVLDQVVRALTGNQYDRWLILQKAGGDGSDSYEWDQGIAP